MKVEDTDGSIDCPVKDIRSGAAFRWGNQYYIRLSIPQALERAMRAKVMGIRKPIFVLNVRDDTITWFTGDTTVQPVQRLTISTE